MGQKWNFMLAQRSGGLRELAPGRPALAPLTNEKPA
jgi:hypothetical protein